jgi:excisionase family DNA binding protein
MSSTPLITVREAAQRLRVPPAEIVRLAREGKIRSRLEAFQRLVYLEDVIRLETERSGIVDGTSRTPVSQRSKARRSVRTQPRSPQPQQLPGCLTVADVAYMLQIDPRTVREYIYCGKLEARKIDGFWYIPKDSIARFVNTKPHRRRWLRTKDAARLLGVYHRTIIAAIKSGMLGACRVGYKYRINPQSVYRILGKRSKLIPVHEAARILELERSTVRDLVYKGKLKAHRFFNRVYIEPSSLQQLASQRAAEKAERQEAQRKGWVQLSEAARMLGCDYTYLRYLVRQKRLPTWRIGRYCYLAPDVVETLRKLLQQRQRRRAKAIERV